MSAGFKIHIVQPGETLETISRFYKIANPERLISFHNQKCLPAYIIKKEKKINAGQVLYVPSYICNNENKIGSSLSFNRLQLSLQDFNEHYRINITEKTLRNNILKENEILFNAHFQWKQHDDPDVNIICYTKSACLVNGQAPELKVYALALESFKDLYPLELIIADNGTVILLHNLQQLQSRWAASYTRLRSLYDDMYSKNYLSAMNETIHDPELLQKMIKRDLVLQCFFAPLYQTYSAGRCSVEITCQSSCIKYEVQQNVFDDEKNIIVEQTGVCIDKRPWQEIIAGVDLPFAQNARAAHSSELPVSEFSGVYRLNNITKHIENARIGIRLPLYEEEEITQVDIQQI